ncbi:hypothetical protein [Microlunatus soli]|uniref:Uncharacterized protein n=1 Tax=Microlunatus soli TaxID=630515 RepID=A0A1H1SMR0_9ACTN|nr:hypothetical protein [Microlunatus soli]SDS48669.1 hypothetical protein SAMN04489812_2055 [Microlunatus soli]
MPNELSSSAAVPLTEIEWKVGTGRWEAVCSARSGADHVTMLFKVLAGNWQIIYLHRG